jgi:hypothetical protein
MMRRTLTGQLLGRITLVPREKLRYKQFEEVGNHIRPALQCTVKLARGRFDAQVVIEESLN